MVYVCFNVLQASCFPNRSLHVKVLAYGRHFPSLQSQSSVLFPFLRVDRYIDQISIIADERKFVSALIIPEYKLVKEYAAKKGIRYESMEELLQKPEIIDLFKERIDTLQQQFAHYEQIKRFTLLPHPFSMERGELTNTLKIKRNVLNKNYAAEIEKMYEE